MMHYFKWKIFAVLKLKLNIIDRNLIRFINEDSTYFVDAIFKDFSNRKYCNI